MNDESRQTWGHGLDLPIPARQDGVSTATITPLVPMTVNSAAHALRCAGVPAHNGRYVGQSIAFDVAIPRGEG